VTSLRRSAHYALLGFTTPCVRGVVARLCHRDGVEIHLGTGGDVTSRAAAYLLSMTPTNSPRRGSLAGVTVHPPQTPSGASMKGRLSTRTANVIRFGSPMKPSSKLAPIAGSAQLIASGLDRSQQMPLGGVEVAGRSSSLAPMA